MIHYPGCPVCKSGNIKPSLTARDHTVSNKLFEVWYCSDCTAMFTQDVPSMGIIGNYYKSENYISHSDTQKGFINRLYHVVRKYTLSAKRKLITNETGLAKGNILDVGSGTGAFLQSMQEAGWMGTGLEPDDTARKKSRELYNVHALPPGELFNFQHASFDTITLWHVLEHVHELHSYMEQLKNLLKENGLIFIAVPNYTSFDAIYYKEQWAGYDVPRHLYHFSPKAMKSLMDIHGLKIKKSNPMWFDSYYVSMLSEQYRKGGIIKAFSIGLLSNFKAIFDKKKCSSLIYIISKI